MSERFTAAQIDAASCAICDALGGDWFREGPQGLRSADGDGAREREVFVLRVLPDRHEICADTYLNEPGSPLHGWMPGCTAWRPLPAAPEGV